MVNKIKINLNLARIRINFQFAGIRSLPVFMITECYMSITSGQMRTLLTIGNSFEDHDGNFVVYNRSSINIKRRFLFKNCTLLKTSF
jgi:hypothetical protein